MPNENVVELLSSQAAVFPRKTLPEFFGTLGTDCGHFYPHVISIAAYHEKLCLSLSQNLPESEMRTQLSTFLEAVVLFRIRIRISVGVGNAGKL